MIHLFLRDEGCRKVSFVCYVTRSYDIFYAVNSDKLHQVSLEI